MANGKESADLQAQKAAIRTQLKDVRNSIAPEDRSAMAEQVEERLFSLPVLREAGVVLVFYSFGSEVPTDRIIKRLAEEGRTVLLPFMDGGDMAAAELRPGDALTPTPYGPKEPSHREPIDPARVDVVITPGLAFDRSGHRIGYGGGNYDRFLARLRPHATRIGIAFHVQILPAVPHGPSDEPVHFVVTDREVIER